MGQILGFILRFLFAWIDAILARLITEVYNLLMDLANLMLSGDNIVKGIGQRLGLILGIFMLFRLAITLINYLISPDKLKDASKGGAKLITNIIFSLVLLGTVNVIFKEAYKVQKTLINSKIIENVFFGKTENAKMDIGYYIYSSVFTPNTEVVSDACESLWDTTTQIHPGCEDQLDVYLDTSEMNSIKKTRNSLNFSSVFSDYSLVTAHKGGITSGDFVFDYIPILSNAVGVISLLILISFCMDLALRAVKLLFLQIIAPIPIISNMDPGKGKDTFQKWYKECFKTYITVFIRLITINFAVFMLSLIKGNYKDIFNDNLLLNVFLIIGCLLFAKQVPKLIEDMFGIKMDGMVLHPLKRFQEQAVLGKKIAGVGIGAVAGTASGLRAAGTNMFVAPGTGGRFLGAGAGFTSAFSKSLTGGFRGDKFGKIFSSSYAKAMENKEKRVGRKDDDVGFLEMEINKIQRAAHQKTRGQRADELNTAIDSFKQNGEAIKNAVYANDKRAGSMSVNGRTFNGAKGLKEFIDSLQAPIQQAGETAASYAARQQDYLNEKKKYQDALDLRVAEVASGRRAIDDGSGGRAGGAAANASVRKIMTTMQEQRKSINKEGKDLYGADFNEIVNPAGFTGTSGDYNTTSGRTIGLKNSLGGATGAQTTIKSHAGHDRDVDKYGAKKDAK